MHNLSKYDAHLILKAYEKDSKINCIANTTEKLLTFQIGSFKFIDSISFLPTSLDDLVETLKKAGTDKFTHFNNRFTSNRDLLLQKGVYPYDYMNSFERFKETSLPSIDAFYNNSEKKVLPLESYKHAQEVWDKLNITNLGEYHDLYLTTDVLLLADCFEEYRKSAYESYELDCTHFISLPSYSWKAMLKKTDAEVSVFSDIDMHMMIERGIRGRISVISKRYAKANNKYMTNYDKSKPSKYLMYLDANALYAHSMTQYLPTGDYEWGNPEDFNEAKILKMKHDQKTGYIFDVVLEYPHELHDVHNDYPLAPEIIKVTSDMLSDFQKHPNHKPFSKLCPNLNDKKNYVVHYRNLKFYLEKGLKF